MDGCNFEMKSILSKFRRPSPVRSSTFSGFSILAPGARQVYQPSAIKQASAVSCGVFERSDQNSRSSFDGGITTEAHLTEGRKCGQPQQQYVMSSLKGALDRAKSRRGLRLSNDPGPTRESGREKEIST